MGVYDTYNGIQLKVGPCLCEDYELADNVPIEDGIYVGHGGFVVIISGILHATFDALTTKWGGVITPHQVLDIQFSGFFENRKESEE